MPKLTIRQWPLPIETGNATILDAALKHGVPFPHGCRAGECGACKCLLLAGDVTMKNYDSEALTEAEKAAGFVLACRAKPRADVHVALLGGTGTVHLPVRRVPAQITNIEQVNPVIKRLYLWPERPLRFAAGQFARLKFADLPARPYSMANMPDEEVLEFHIRMIPDGRVSEHIGSQIEVGDVVQIEGPFGNAHLRPEDDSPLVLVAGSSGLAPAKSIVRTALHDNPDRRVHLYFGVRSEAHVYDKRELKALALHYKNLRIDTVVSNPTGKTSRRSGDLAQVVFKDMEAHRDAQFYMAGPPDMVSAVSKMVTEFGIDQEQIHADPFHVAGNDRADEAQPSSLNKLLDSMRGLLAIGRPRSSKSREAPLSAEALQAPAERKAGPRARTKVTETAVADSDRRRID